LEAVYQKEFVFTTTGSLAMLNTMLNSEIKNSLSKTVFQKHFQ